ncbi:MAG: putative collagen-binding domain-containing protein, partial [Planctomycetota bacterium]
VDPYDHHVVVHTFPDQQDAVYSKLLGEKSGLTGASLQNAWNAAHRRTLQWINASREAGWPWVCANDEQGPANLGVPPDPGYEGFDGKAGQGKKAYDLHEIRKRTLWGTLMAGGAGVEYYFGYQLPQNDILCQDFRSRDRSWDYCRIALEFFQRDDVPFTEMESADALVDGTDRNGHYCLAKPGQIYLVYLPSGGASQLDLAAGDGSFDVLWFNPRDGGDLQTGSVESVDGGSTAKLGEPPADSTSDWLAVVRKASTE